MGADLQSTPGWGNDSLLLSLPFATVRFNALSEQQRDSLGSTYSSFVIDSVSANTSLQAISDCFAYRLPRPLEIPSDMISVNGHYTPVKIHNATGIELTGINFKARIQPGDRTAPSFLGVAEESELAHANVVENFLRVMAAHRALEHGGVLLHSAGLVFDQQAYVFCGKSGAGKTTLTRKAYECGAGVLSDDINLLTPDAKSNFFAHAIPFTGEFGRTLVHDKYQDAYPVACVVLLEQSNQLTATKVIDSQAVARLLTGCPFVNTDASESDKLFDIVTELVRQTPVVRLQLHIDDPIESILQSIRMIMEND